MKKTWGKFKKMKKKVGKAKAKLSTNSILKKINLTKIIFFKKNMWGKHCSQTKTM